MIRAIISALLRPILALLAGLGFYAKGRADQRQREIAKAHEASLKTIERIEDAKERAAAGGGTWHDRLRRDDE